MTMQQTIITTGAVLNIKLYVHFFIGLVSDFGSKIFLCYFMLLLRIIFVHIYHIAVDLNNCISAE